MFHKFVSRLTNSHSNSNKLSFCIEEKKIMKRWTWIFIILVLVVTCTGCTAYTTSDGQEFKSLEEAEAHQQKIIESIQYIKTAFHWTDGELPENYNQVTLYGAGGTYQALDLSIIADVTYMGDWNWVSQHFPDSGSARLICGPSNDVIDRDEVITFPINQQPCSHGSLLIEDHPDIGIIYPEAGYHEKWFSSGDQLLPTAQEMLGEEGEVSITLSCEENTWQTETNSLVEGLKNTNETIFGVNKDDLCQNGGRLIYNP